jgi:hypothetical protein
VSANYAFDEQIFEEEVKLSKSVFISHAVKDKGLVQEIVA